MRTCLEKRGHVVTITCTFNLVWNSLLITDLFYTNFRLGSIHCLRPRKFGRDRRFRSPGCPAATAIGGISQLPSDCGGGELCATLRVHRLFSIVEIDHRLFLIVSGPSAFQSFCAPNAKMASARTFVVLVFWTAIAATSAARSSIYYGNIWKTTISHLSIKTSLIRTPF